LKGIDMIDTETVESFNTRLTVDTSNISRLTPAQRDSIKHYGSQAEALLKNRDLAMFVHHYKFELADGLANITGHADIDNQTRVALSNYLSGIDGFVTSLKRAIYQRNKILKAEQQPSVDNTPI
jgi:hypothetical protein